MNTKLLLITTTAIAACAALSQELLQPVSPVPAPVYYRATLTPDEAQSAISNLSTIVDLPTNVAPSQIQSVDATVQTNGEVTVTVRILPAVATNSP
jgi:hypothetical protein